MSTSIQSVDDIRSGFPHPTVPTIEGEPHYTSIKQLHDLLKSNAAAFPSTLGGGGHGLLGLVLPPAVYLNVTGHNFNRPQNPGDAPVIPPGATQAQIGQLTRTFNTASKTYLETVHTDQALKQLILGAVDNIYLDSLRNAYTGYTAVTTQDLLDHLYTNYGQISDFDLEENEKRMKTKYDPSLPIDTLFKQIENAVEFAIHGNAPFTPRQIVNTAFLLLFATGAYEDDCKEWKRRPVAQHTWANFKIDFMRAYRNQRELQRLQQQGSAETHFGANVTTTQPTLVGTVPPVTTDAPEASLAQDASTISEFYADANDRFEALANATLESGNHMALLANENRQMQEQMRTMQDFIMRCTIIGPEGTSPRPTLPANNQQGRGRTGRGGRSNRTVTRRQNNGYDPNSNHYCWSHGRTCTPNHISLNCRTPEPSHQRNATFDNRMNGSNFRCQRANHMQQE